MIGGRRNDGLRRGSDQSRRLRRRSYGNLNRRELAGDTNAQIALRHFDFAEPEARRNFCKPFDNSRINGRWKVRRGGFLVRHLSNLQKVRGQQQGMQREIIGFCPKPEDDALCDGGDVGMTSETLTRMNIREMDLDNSGC